MQAMAAIVIRDEPDGSATSRAAFHCRVADVVLLEYRKLRGRQTECACLVFILPNLCLPTVDKALDPIRRGDNVGLCVWHLAQADDRPLGNLNLIAVDGLVAVFLLLCGLCPSESKESQLLAGLADSQHGVAVDDLRFEVLHRVGGFGDLGIDVRDTVDIGLSVMMFVFLVEWCRCRCCFDLWTGCSIAFAEVLTNPLCGHLAVTMESDPSTAKSGYGRPNLHCVMQTTKRIFHNHF